MPAPEPLRIAADAVDLSSGFRGVPAFQGLTPPAAAQTYAITNVSTLRAGDADTVTTAQLADIVGTLIADLRTLGLVN